MIKYRTERAGTPRWWQAAVLGAVIAAFVVIGITAVPGKAEAASGTAEATSSDIRLAQSDLNGLGYNAGTVDGVAGPQTTAAASAFQSDRCLSVDGLIGPQTLGELETVVKAVQAAAGVPADGYYAASTTNAVRNYQTAHGLTVDGIAGSNTMASMGITRLIAKCHDPSTLGAAIVSIAKGEMGTQADSNQCVPGKPYNICADWCATFATWVWRDAGVNIPLESYVPDVYDWAIAHGKWYGASQLGLARSGYMIVFGTATNRYHIGIVDQVIGGMVYVISGNTTNPSDSNQWGVYDKAYPLSDSVFYGLVHQ